MLTPARTLIVALLMTLLILAAGLFLPAADPATANLAVIHIAEPGLHLHLRGIRDLRQGLPGRLPRVFGQGVEEGILALRCRADEIAAAALKHGRLALRLGGRIEDGLDRLHRQRPGGHRPRIYWVQSGIKGEINRCMVRDPSSINWLGLEQAIHGNIVPDFPVCNKSFNQSYSGHDL